MIRPVLLSGRAGSGKTYRCLAEIAALLREDPAGAPLILVAPRQATYQLERQILSFPGVDGFARLRIVSFQRLADFVFESTGRAAPKVLPEQGRIMVLRALLAKHREALRVFRESARHEGLARELSDLWREMAEHRVTTARLLDGAKRLEKENKRLAAKLEDFAKLFSAYEAWLKENELSDGDELLDFAAEAAEAGPLPEIAGLWLDGFAQMTPQERRLVLAVLPKCARATFAFCLPPPSAGEELDPISTWSVVGRTYGQFRAELVAKHRVQPVDEVLPAPGKERRFEAAPALAHLEAHWSAPKGFEEEMANQLRVVKCGTPEGEATFVAREILKFVRGGGRFREAAVLARSLDHCHDIVQRVFRRYGIPCFLDRRESVAHHPLAELTRGTLRSIAFEFLQRDVFCALKSGLAGLGDEEVDLLENYALARAWSGATWRNLTFDRKISEGERRRVAMLRDTAFAPVDKLILALGEAPNGKRFEEAVRAFWDELRVEEALEKWEAPIHDAVWTQMSEWLKTVGIAFANTPMNLREWVQVVEAGLAALTVGLIPPSLDQVLVGAIDRSRNPDLRAVFLMGVNEGIFPAPGKEKILLSDAERDELARANCALADGAMWNLGRERFYGYIACTRARQSVTVTLAHAASDGSPLNPSIFVQRLKRLFPKLAEEEFAGTDWTGAEAAHELNPLIFQAAFAKDGETLGHRMMDWPVFAETRERARAGAVVEGEKLSDEAVARLYGRRIRTSASRLEEFAGCAFRFFVSSGLRAEERLQFKLDSREKGAFTHELLAEFHRRVTASKRKWREVSAEEARVLVEQIATDLEATFQDGLALVTATNRFQARAKVAGLQDFLAGYLELLRGCKFDPAQVELPFGFQDKPEAPSLPAWTVAIPEVGATLEFTGRIDRIDVAIDEANRRCLALVLDYKSSGKKLDRVLVEHAIQQQLPAYLSALKNVDATGFFPHPVEPAGAFYVVLKPKVESAKTREAAFDEDEIGEDLAQPGVFNSEVLPLLDPGETHALFQYPKTKRASGSVTALPAEEFRALLTETEKRVAALGRRILEGEVAMNPYVHKNACACDYCPHKGICRIDAWTHDFRELA